MKTALFVGINGHTGFLQTDYDRIICTDSRLFTNATEDILDIFINTMRSHGFRVKLSHIYYDRPFYVKCFNQQKYVKYYFNTCFPHGSLLNYEQINAIIFGRDYSVHSPQYKNSLIASIRKYLKDDCAITQT